MQLRLLAGIYTNMTPPDTKKILEEIKANQSKLESCKKHNFQRLDDNSKLFSKYRCALCGGIVDVQAMHWYNKGIQHASENEFYS